MVNSTGTKVDTGTQCHGVGKQHTLFCCPFRSVDPSECPMSTHSGGYICVPVPIGHPDKLHPTRRRKKHHQYQHDLDDETGKNSS